jgi:hypothetical protein
MMSEIRQKWLGVVRLLDTSFLLRVSELCILFGPRLLRDGGCRNNNGCYENCAFITFVASSSTYGNLLFLCSLLGEICS